MKKTPTTLTAPQIEEMAYEIRRFLIDKRLWVDTEIYFNGKAFSTRSELDSGEIANNDPERLFVIDDVDVSERLRIEDDILSMQFTGPLYFMLGHSYRVAADVLEIRDRKEHPTVLDEARNFVSRGLQDIFQKRGLVYEMVTDYKLTAVDPDQFREEEAQRVFAGDFAFLPREQEEQLDRFVDWGILTKYWAEAIAGEHPVIRGACYKIAKQAFAWREDIKSVTMREGVEIIGNAAFMGCENLATIDIPDSVRIIEPLAFAATPWFDNQPDGLVYAGKVAYEYKGEMPENAAIVIRDGTRAIAEEALTDSRIASVTIPASVTYIGKGQFENGNEVFKKRVTIRCPENSAAHKYALDNGMKIELLE